MQRVAAAGMGDIGEKVATGWACPAGREGAECRTPRWFRHGKYPVFLFCSFCCFPFFTVINDLLTISVGLIE